MLPLVGNTFRPALWGEANVFFLVYDTKLTMFTIYTSIKLTTKGQHIALGPLGRDQWYIHYCTV
jgi:hypothetical protein